MILALVNFCYHQLNAQYCSDSGTIYNWPNYYQGDTQYFKRTAGKIVSNYPFAAKNTYSLWASCESNEQVSQFEISFKISINLSSSNFLRIGFYSRDSVKNYLQFGNTQDQWQWYQNDSLHASGKAKEFDLSSFQLKLTFYQYKDSLWFNFQNFNTGKKTQTFLSNQANRFLLNNVFLEIQQYGTSAIGKHQFWNLSWREFTPDTLLPTAKKINQIDNHHFQIQWNQLTVYSPSVTLKLIEGTCKLQSISSDSTSWNCEFKLPINTLPDSLHLEINPLEGKNGRIAHYFQLVMPYQFLDTPQFGDLVITEILTHPNSNVQYSAAVNFIELTNLSDHWLNLGLVTLSDAQTKVSLPKVGLKPKSSIVLCKLSDTAQFQCPTIGLTPFPYFNQTEDEVHLMGILGPIEELTYSNDLFAEFACNGGYSLQKLHKQWPTITENNWGNISANPTSPGRWNFEDSLTPPDSIDLLECYRVRDTIFCRFNQEVLNVPSVHFMINGNPVSFQRQTAYLAHIFWNQTTNIRANLISVILNDSQTISKPIQIIHPISTTIKFNEIMYRCSEISTDYIELYNADSIAGLLSDLSLWIYDKNQVLRQILPLKNAQRNLMLPGEYVAICNQKIKITGFQTLTPCRQIVQVSNFPNLLSEGGKILLQYLPTLKIIEDCDFNDNLQSPIFDDFGGKSIEKINVNIPSSVASNWGSALNSPFFGTPGYTNSIVNYPIQQNKAMITITPKVWFYNEKITQPLICDYQFPSSGYILKIQAFNSRGEFLGTIMESSMLPQTGQLHFWPKINGKIFSPENYILKFEALTTNGDICRAIKRITIKNL